MPLRPTTIVQVHTESSNWTAIVGIIVAGVVGPALGYAGARCAN